MKREDPLILALPRRRLKDEAPSLPMSERPALVPVVDAPDPEGPWTDIEDFALSCAPVTGHADLPATASLARRLWARYGELPGDPAALRACLFFEQRRWNLFGGEPEGRARAYVAALVRAIAAAVPSNTAASSATDDTDAEIDGDIAEAG